MIAFIIGIIVATLILTVLIQSGIINLKGNSFDLIKKTHKKRQNKMKQAQMVEIMNNAIDKQKAAVDKKIEINRLLGLYYQSLISASECCTQIDLANNNGK